MLDKTTKKEIKQLCDEATLEGLLKILSSEQVKSNIDVFEFIELEYKTRKERLCDLTCSLRKSGRYNDKYNFL